MVMPEVPRPTKARLKAARTKNLLPGAELWRVYHSDSYCSNAADFRHFGPVSRYDHHRMSGGFPAKSSGRSTAYLAKTPGTALAEVFGEEQIVKACPNWRIAEVTVVPGFQMLDLTGLNVMHPGSYASMIGLGRVESQEWARLVYLHRPDVHGIIYTGSHDYGECYVLFDRAHEEHVDGALDVRSIAGRDRDYGLRSLPPTERELISGELDQRCMVLKKVSRKQCKVCQDPARHP